jgi:hypothetical protein
MALDKITKLHSIREVKYSKICFIIKVIYILYQRPPHFLTMLLLKGIIIYEESIKWPCQILQSFYTIYIHFILTVDWHHLYTFLLHHISTHHTNIFITKQIMNTVVMQLQ